MDDMTESFEEEEFRKLDMKSFTQLEFDSEEMKKIVRNANDEEYKRSEHAEYDPSKLFPEWMLKDQKWIKTKKNIAESGVSGIIHMAHWQRTQEQISTLMQWITTCWPIAKNMDPKRLQTLLQSFKVETKEPEEPIILETVNSFTLYIVVSGHCEVSKGGHLIESIGSGRCFGDVTSTDHLATIEGSNGSYASGSSNNLVTVRAKSK